jgi:glucan phosphoethanolaminetransferase (alkaline phosphatase superfamily)
VIIIIFLTSLGLDSGIAITLCVASVLFLGIRLGVMSTDWLVIPATIVIVLIARKAFWQSG